MDWFRFHTSALDNIKIHLLTDEHFRVWVNFLCLCRMFGDVLPDIQTIAFRLRCTVEQAEKWRAELVEKRLIDVSKNGTYTMHDWRDWQPPSDDSAVRKRRQRARESRIVSRDMNNRCPSLEQSRVEQNTCSSAIADGFTLSPDVVISERKSTPGLVVNLRAQQARWFAEFWELCWRRVGRGAAEREFQRRVRSEETWEAVRAAVVAQLPGLMQREVEYRPHPRTWLSQERWRDDAEPVSSGPQRRGSHRAFNSREGQCPYCLGAGTYELKGTGVVECEQCGGTGRTDSSNLKKRVQ